MLREEQRRGLLVFDEIFLRESLSVDSQNLKYTGLEDFGGEVPTAGLKANHGLVFLFQSFKISHSLLLCLHQEVPLKVYNYYK